MWRHLLLFVCIGTCLGLSQTAYAEAKDIQIGAKVISFLDPEPTGDLTAAIIYDPDSSISLNDAEMIRATLSSSQKMHNIKLKPKLVSTNDLKQIEGTQVAFVTEGMQPKQSAAFQATSKAGIVSISSDMACVEAGHCVVGVATSPKVTIIVSDRARKASRIKFGSVFLMMVQEK